MQQPLDAPAGVWDQLAQRLNPAYEQPRLRDGVVTRRLSTSRGEEYYIAKSPAGTYVRLAPDEHFLLPLMDGQRQVKDLVLAYFLQFHTFAFQRVAHVVAQLRQHRFLTEEPRDAWAGLRLHFARQTWGYRIDRLIRGFKYHEFGLNGLDGPLTALYRRGGWCFFTGPALALFVLLWTGGIVLFGWAISHGRHDPLHFQGSYTAGVLVFLPLLLLTVSIHELGHALATKHYGRAVPRGGIMLYYGLPAFFVDTTDIWLEPRRARLVVSAAGMAAVWAVGGLAMLYVVLQHDAPLAPLAFQFAFVAFVNNSLNLLPLLELDGYYLLMDWLEIPLLRARALAFVRGELWRKLRAAEPFNREERIFALFGSLAMGYSLFALGAAVYFWLHRLERLLLDALVQESALFRALVSLVVVALGVPFVFGLGVKLYQLLRSARRGLARLHHRAAHTRAQARLEARELVGRLAFLGDLDFAQREAIVAQLRLERFRPGEYVVRQGEPGEQFYLVRRGLAEVLQVGADGWPRELAVLRRGDYFGELALLYHQPRAASVRALTPLEVYALARDAFTATIAPHLREYGYTVQRIEERSELARMGLFRHTACAELDRIQERLRPEAYPAGASIVREGEPGERFYLLRRGRVQITRRTAAGPEEVVGELGPGEHFGELALLTGAPCSATVRALEPVTLWSLDRASFQELLVEQLRLGGALAAECERREAAYHRLAGEPAA
jgi:CRP-like cAMP-binding protein/Zn-dependent protease